MDELVEAVLRERKVSSRAEGSYEHITAQVIQSLDWQEQARLKVCALIFRAAGDEATMKAAYTVLFWTIVEEARKRATQTTEGGSPA